MKKQRAKTFMRLIKGVKQWGKSRVKDGAAPMVFINVTSGFKSRATDKLLRRAGAACLGGGYVV